MVKLLGGDAARALLIEQATLRPGQRVLDVGCGTGSLLVQIKRRYPSIEIVGLDPDPRALGRARRKGVRAALSLQLDQGFADELPYADASFDRVMSSFMFHHLEEVDRSRMLREVRRVLKPGARLHLMDFVKADSLSGAHRWMRWLHSGPRLKDNSDERILSLMHEVGLSDARRVADRALFLGDIAYYQATRL
jgi:ubiquinone/menaquinone biosynthesis C-methylase UbiE